MTRKYTDSISNFERVAAELRSLRRERRMSQQTLADRAGVSRRTKLSRLMRKYALSL